MRFIKTKISDLVIIEPLIFKDNRGYFYESYNQKKFEDVIGKISFLKIMNLNPLRSIRVFISKTTF